MNLEINFTQHEISQFLIKEGYTIETIKTYRSYNTHHNNICETIHNVEVAYIGGFDVSHRLDGVYGDQLVENYKIEKVFKETIKNKILNL